MKNDKKRAPDLPDREALKNKQSLLPQTNCTINSESCQPFYDNINHELRERLQPKKEHSILLADSYERLGYMSRWERVITCGTYLQYKIPVNADLQPIGKGKILTANFCKDRLCPTCAYRRSLKIFSQVSRIIKAMPKDYDYLMLTLTVPNVNGDDLPKSIDDLMKGIDRLFKRSAVKRAVKGYFRALEITRNACTNTYHPHYHFILAVAKSYFNSRDYLSHQQWLELWRKAMKDESISQIDIRKIKPKDAKKTASEEVFLDAVAEVAKYTVKDDDYILNGNEIRTDEIVKVLARAMSGRRLVHLSGIFKQIANNLKIDDLENGDLVNVDGDLHPIVRDCIIEYHWSIGGYKPVKLIVIDTATSELHPDRPAGSVEYHEYFIEE